MTLKESMQYNAGLYNLDEGLQFFKTSNKIYKFTKRLEKKVDKNPRLMPLFKEMEKIASDFEKLEDSFKNSSKMDKEKLKKDYQELKNRYNKILDYLNKKNVRDTIGKVGVGSIITLSTLFIGAAFKEYADIAGDAENALADVQSKISSTEDKLSQEKLDNVGKDLLQRGGRLPQVIKLETELNMLLNQEAATKDALKDPRGTLGKQVAGALGLTTIAGLIKNLFTSKNEKETFSKLRKTLRRMEK